MKEKSSISYLYHSGLYVLMSILTLGCNSEVPLKGPINNIDNFIENTRFLPTNPVDMTADDCAWFNENQWTLKWKFLLDGISLTPKEEQVVKVEMESLLKTYSYLVFTKPFANYINKAFKEHNFVSASSNSKETVSALGLVLAYRGINSDSFKNSELVIRLHNRGGIYTSEIDSQPKLKNEFENYTNIIKKTTQKWDFHSLVLKDKKMQINIPFKYSEPDYSIMDLPKKDKKWSNSKFSVPLVFHELAHTFWNWTHPGGDGIDLTYTLGAMAGNMINGWPGDNNLTTITEIPSEGTGSEITEKVKRMEKYIGGHLPMGMVYSWYPYSAHYSLNVQYVMHHLDYEVYPVTMPTIGIGELNENVPKENPANPFPCINWKIDYTPQ